MKRFTKENLIKHLLKRKYGKKNTIRHYSRKYRFLFLKKIRLRLVECKIFSGENIFEKGKYFQVFGYIPKNALENIF